MRSSRSSPAARERGAGVLVLVRTSNPGAADVEDLALAEGGAVWERVAAIVDELGAPGVGEAGAERRWRSRRRDRASPPRARARADAERHPSCSRASARRAGACEDLAPAFAPGRAGGLISASRSIANAHRRAAASRRRRHARRPSACGRARGRCRADVLWRCLDRSGLSRVDVPLACTGAWSRPLSYGALRRQVQSQNDHHRHAQRGDRQVALGARTSGSAVAIGRSTSARRQAARA